MDQNVDPFYWRNLHQFSNAWAEERRAMAIAAWVAAGVVGVLAVGILLAVKFGGGG